MTRITIVLGERGIGDLSYPYGWVILNWPEVDSVKALF
jgi:hypothetical protein